MQPWYAQQGSSFFKKEEEKDNLPSRIRREKEKLKLLQGGGRSNGGDLRIADDNGSGRGRGADNGSGTLLLGAPASEVRSILPPSKRANVELRESIKDKKKSHKEHKEHKKDKKEKRDKDKKRDKHHDKGGSGGGASKSIEQLRKERMLREEMEHKRERAVLVGKDGGFGSTQQNNGRQYHSGFGNAPPRRR